MLLRNRGRITVVGILYNDVYDGWGNVFNSVKRIFKGAVLYENQLIDKITLLEGTHNKNKKKV